MADPTSTFLAALSSSCSNGSVNGQECLLRVHGNLCRMLEARGYATVRSHCTTVEDMLARMCREQPVVSAAASVDGKRDAMTYMCTDPKIGIKYMRTIADKAEGASDGGIVIVLSIEGPTSFTRRDSKDDDAVQFLTFRQLFNDISRHKLVPAHRKLSDDERAAVAARYNMRQPAQWPVLLLRDPMCAFYDFRCGDVIEITRRGTGAYEEYKYYRMVQ